MHKPELQMIAKELGVSGFQPMTPTLYAKIKKRIKNADAIGLINNYFDKRSMVWQDPEFEDAGWLWDSEYAKSYGIKQVLKNNALQNLKYYKKQACVYLDDTYICLVKTKAIPTYAEHEALVIIFSDSLF